MAAVAVVMAAGTSACSSSGHSGSALSARPTGSSAGTASAAAGGSTTGISSSAGTATTAGGPQDTTPAFGHPFTWTDGLQVAVSQPTPYTPAAGATGPRPGDAVYKVTVTVTNRAGTYFNSGQFTLTLRTGTPGTAAAPVSDPSLPGFAGPIEAGTTATAAYAFAVPKAAVGGRLDIEVEPDGGVAYQPVHWVGTGS